MCKNRLQVKQIGNCFNPLDSIIIDYNELQRNIMANNRK